MSAKYRTSDGRYRTQSLFKEEIQKAQRGTYTYVFTLSTEDKDVPSLHRLFVEQEDPTEYKFAIEVLGSWHHWQLLKECVWFKPYYAAMRLELDTRLKSKGVDILKDIANSNKPTAATAAKWLAEGGWSEKKTKPATKRGRPSDAEVAGELKRLAHEAAEIHEDADRLGLRIPGVSHKPN